MPAGTVFSPNVAPTMGYQDCRHTLNSPPSGAGALVVQVTRTGVPPATCPATAGAAVLARQVKSCRFVYDPNQGATQQSGFISIQLELARDSESASLILGAHVVNVP